MMSRAREKRGARGGARAGRRHVVDRSSGRDAADPRGRGAFAVDQPERTPLSPFASEHLPGPAGVVLPALLAAARIPMGRAA
jgi:hypothetical protein